GGLGDATGDAVACRRLQDGHGQAEDSTHLPHAEAPFVAGWPGRVARPAVPGSLRKLRGMPHPAKGLNFPPPSQGHEILRRLARIAEGRGGQGVWVAGTGIGPALRRARLLRGKSIEEASRETRIRAEYLQALERETFDAVLGDV